MQVMRVTVPSDLSNAELEFAANGTRNSPAEEFVTLADGEVAGYLEMDLRPDQRYLYLTVPGSESQPDGKVRDLIGRFFQTEGNGFRLLTTQAKLCLR